MAQPLPGRSPLHTPAQPHSPPRATIRHARALSSTVRASAVAGGGDGELGAQLRLLAFQEPPRGRGSSHARTSSRDSLASSIDDTPSSGERASGGDPLEMAAAWRAVAAASKGPLVAGVAALALATACNLANPVLVAGMLDAVVAPAKHPAGTAQAYLAAFGVAAGVQWAAHRVYQEVWLLTGETLLERLYVTAISVLLRTQSVLTSRTGAADLLLAAEHERLRALLKASCATPDAGLRGCLKFVGAAVLFCVAAPDLAPVCAPLFVGALSLVLARNAGTAAKEASASAAAGVVAARTAALLRALRFIRTSNTEGQETVVVATLSKNALATSLAVHRRTSNTQVVAAVFVTVAWTLLFVRGTQLFSAGAISFFQLQAALSCAFELTSSMNGTLNFLRDSLSAAAALRRVRSLLATTATAGATPAVLTEPRQGGSEDDVVSVNAALRHAAVDDVTGEVAHTLQLGALSLRSGHVATLSGPSGAGKSMLLDVIAGVQPLSPSRGARITLNGQRIDTSDPAYRTLVSYCPQSATNDLPPGEVASIIAGGILGGGTDSAAVVQAAHQLANLDRLPAVELHSVGARLSGGQQQRVGHARAYARCMRHWGDASGEAAAMGPAQVLDPSHAAFLVFDEPTSALDDALTRQFWVSVGELVQRTGVGVLVVTHYPDEVAQYYTAGPTTSVVMDAQGTLSAVSAAPAGAEEAAAPAGAEPLEGQQPVCTGR
jgi:thiamine transport system ATP-binding protein